MPSGMNHRLWHHQLHPFGKRSERASSPMSQLLSFAPLPALSNRRGRSSFLWTICLSLRSKQTKCTCFNLSGLPRPYRHGSRFPRLLPWLPPCSPGSRASAVEDPPARRGIFGPRQAVLGHQCLPKLLGRISCTETSPKLG